MENREERRTARNWYWWLWLSPLLTIPTLFVLVDTFTPFYEGWASCVVSHYSCGGHPVYACDWERADRILYLVAITGSSLWHLILLIPALGGGTRFVRLHGWQALLLAAARTAIPFVGFVIFGADSSGFVVIQIFLLLIVWFVGTLWGQLQTSRKCTLMRLFGCQPELSPTPAAAHPPDSTEALLDVICYSDDPNERHRAAEELIRRGMAARVDSADKEG